MPSNIHVVSVALDLDCADAAVLSDEERERAARFVFDRDRRRYTVAHSALRRVLAASLGDTPRGIRFAIGPRGKPHLHGSRLHFNLTHSGDRALIALAEGRAVGIDIERHQPIDVLAMAQHVFCCRERAALARTPPQDRYAAFFRGWTRKESFIKARGDGLYFPLTGFEVSLEESATQILLDCRAAPADVGRWSIVALDAGERAAAALTVEKPASTVVTWHSMDEFIAHASRHRVVAP
jgi:4'-phosphopantetheinyl transferase